MERLFYQLSSSIYKSYIVPQNEGKDDPPILDQPESLRVDPNEYTNASQHPNNQ